MERRHLLCGLQGIKMKPPLFDCMFLVVFASVSIIAKDASAANTTEGSTEEKSTNEADTKMLICILSLNTIKAFFRSILLYLKRFNSICKFS